MWHIRIGCAERLGNLMLNSKMFLKWNIELAFNDSTNIVLDMRSKNDEHICPVQIRSVERQIRFSKHSDLRVYVSRSRRSKPMLAGQVVGTIDGEAVYMWTGLADNYILTKDTGYSFILLFVLVATYASPFSFISQKSSLKNICRCIKHYMI